MARDTTRLFFFTLLFGVSNGQYGPTLISKVGNDLGGQIAWIASSCQINVVNTTVLVENLNERILAQTSNTCNEDNTISSMGIGSDSVYLMKTSGRSSVDYLYYSNQDITQLSTLVLESHTFSRISNAQVYNGRDVFFAATNHNDTHEGQVVALAVDSTSNVEVLASIDTGVTFISDVQMASSSNESALLYVTSSTGLVKLTFTFTSDGVYAFNDLSVVSGSAGDGMSISASGDMAYVAAQGAGLAVYALSGAGTQESLTDLSGNWAGGAALLDTLSDNNQSVLVLIAADPGLYAFDVSEPSEPVEQWLCHMDGLGGGTGWNVEVSGAYAYVSDYDGGLQVVQLQKATDDNESFMPVIVSHFGAGVIQKC